MKARANALKRARALIKGLVISWSDPAPLRDTTDIRHAKVTHRNPILRLTADKVMQDFGDWIINRQAFRWLVTINVIFDYPNGTRQTETRELEAVARISDLNEHCMESIKEAMRYGDAKCYRHTEFTIECLGSN